MPQWPEMRPENRSESVDLVKRIALLGGESSGKTTLARALADALRTLWVPEYGRELWEDLRRTLTPAELVQVGQVQVAWEQEHAERAAAQGARWLICDTTPLTTLQYCLADHVDAPVELQELAARPYDLTVLCLPDFAFVQDGCRRDDDWRRAQHDWTVAQLAVRGVTPLVVQGPVQQRLALVLAAVARLEAAALETEHTPS